MKWIINVKTVKAGSKREKLGNPLPPRIRLTVKPIMYLCTEQIFKGFCAVQKASVFHPSSTKMSKVLDMKQERHYGLWWHLLGWPQMHSSTFCIGKPLMSVCWKQKPHTPRSWTLHRQINRLDKAYMVSLTRSSTALNCLFILYLGSLLILFHATEEESRDLWNSEAQKIWNASLHQLPLPVKIYW